MDGILRVNVRHAHCSQFILGISEHSTQGRIRIFEHLCFNVGNQDAIGTSVKKRAVSGLRLPAFLPLRGFDQRPQYGRDQPVRSLLEHVIGRATEQAVHRLLLAQRPGDQDERDIGLFRSSQCQRCQAIVIGQAVVREDQVKTCPGQRGLVFRAIARDPQLAGHAGQLQLVPH